MAIIDFTINNQIHLQAVPPDWPGGFWWHWLFFTVVIIGFVIKRLNRKKRIHKLEEYEALHSTDFDYGEVEKPDEDKPWD